MYCALPLGLQLTREGRNTAITKSHPGWRHCKPGDLPFDIGSQLDGVSGGVRGGSVRAGLFAG